MKLLRMGLVEDKRCWKCEGENGTFLHVFWKCPLAVPFWKKSIKEIWRLVEAKDTRVSTVLPLGRWHTFARRSQQRTACTNNCRPHHSSKADIEELEEHLYAGARRLDSIDDGDCILRISDCQEEQC